MQKIKYAVYEKFKNTNPSKAEIIFLVHIAKHQDIHGHIIGVSYRNFLNLGLSIQTYYNVRKSLCDKGIISYTKNEDYGDCDITILGNDFSDGDYSCGYISLRKCIFSSTIFYRMKAGAQLLLFELIKICQSNGGTWKISTTEFYKNYKGIFGVNKRTVRDYLHIVKIFINVELHNKNYIFSLRKVSKHTEKKSDEARLNEHCVQVLARRKHIRIATVKEVSETAQLVKQYQEYADKVNRRIWEVLEQAIDESIAYINRYNHPREKKEYALRYKLIHKIMRKELKLS